MKAFFKKISRKKQKFPVSSENISKHIDNVFEQNIRLSLTRDCQSAAYFGMLHIIDLQLSNRDLSIIGIPQHGYFRNLSDAI